MPHFRVLRGAQLSVGCTLRQMLREQGLEGYADDLEKKAGIDCIELLAFTPRAELVQLLGGKTGNAGRVQYWLRVHRPELLGSAGAGAGKAHWD